MELLITFIGVLGDNFKDITLVLCFIFITISTFKSQKSNRETRESVNRIESTQLAKIPAVSRKMISIVKKSATINRELDKMVGKLGADRGWLYLFHNMGHDFLGQPFAKVTNTNESISPGIDSRIAYMRDIPIGVMSCYVDKLIENGEILCEDIEDYKENDKTAYSYLYNLGVKSTYSICIYAPRPEHKGKKGKSSKGEIPLGFVGIDYLRSHKKLNDDEYQLFHDYAMIIKGLLIERREVELDQGTCVIDGSEAYNESDYNESIDDEFG